MQQKREIRKIFSAARKALTPEERLAADKAIRERIKHLAAYQECKALALYATDGTEPDLLPLMQEPGKILLFPRYCAERGVYKFASVSNLSDLVPGKYNLPEPSAQCPEADEELVRTATLHLVPGVAWDLRGVRLGRGGGFYDRLLEEVSGPVCGVYYACQRSSADLPAEAHDRFLDMAVTEAFTVIWK
ncbi:MAG: 5-formyltetrahydrofolate cyclo-ligase [Lentisphaeria bacterium]|nr:5-formyltetrahydrofolate cyclo-ligase [Lentisphaeria bacterium]